MRPAGAGAPAGAAPSRSSRGRLHSAFEDPLSALPETARKLLLAAKGIIANDGFHALTLNAVSAAAGENKAMISYYFGNKAGLVAAVLDSVIHDEYIASQDRMRDVDPRRRTQRLVEEMRRMDAVTEDFQVFFELLPHVLRDETLRRRIAALYRWYWSVKLEWLGVGSPSRGLEDPELLGLAQILSAVIDGLAIQAAIDPGLDLANPYRVFYKMLEGAGFALPDGELGGGGPAGGGPERSSA
ncbi:MAG: TetR/AcrR family transcriptional regulator [Actinomycetes bacterium]